MTVSSAARNTPSIGLPSHANTPTSSTTSCAIASTADAPKIQDRIVQAHERNRDLVAAAKERELLGRLYAKGTDWYRANQNNPDALAAAQQLSEDALLFSAVG